MFKMATWNVNSLRVRLSHVLTWLDEQQPDVLALQEIKLADADFPQAEFLNVGYQCIWAGQKTYNGVAVLSRTSLTEVVNAIPGYADPHRRVIAATVQGVRIINLYVPNGASVDSEKYSYKLAWLKQVTLFVQQQLMVHPYLVVVGDLNIAPADNDVCDPLAWQGQVLVSDLERQAFRRLLAIGLEDTFRLFSLPDRTYSWWDYRALAFRRNQGLRIDHILASEPLLKHCKACLVDKRPRTWERPSDHAPVLAEFDVVDSG